MKRAAGAALIVATMALTGACGGGSDDRPTKAEVSKSLSGKDSMFGTTIPDAAVDCVAGVLVDSNLSDKGLRAIVEGDKSASGDKDDEKALLDVTTKFGECVTK